MFVHKLLSLLFFLSLFVVVVSRDVVSGGGDGVDPFAGLFSASIAWCIIYFFVRWAVHLPSSQRDLCGHCTSDYSFVCSLLCFSGMFFIAFNGPVFRHIGALVLSSGFVVVFFFPTVNPTTA